MKPKDYFRKLLGMPESEVDYSDNPPTAEADWQDAEFLLPVTQAEFRDVKRFIDNRRSQNDAPQHPA